MRTNEWSDDAPRKARFDTVSEAFNYDSSPMTALLLGEGGSSVCLRISWLPKHCLHLIQCLVPDQIPLGQKFLS